jgi:hypothetical protein
VTIDSRDSTEPELVLAAQVLARVDAVAREAGVEYLVVGATARTILSIGLVGRPPERATRGVDIAAAVGSWADFQRLADKLEKRGRSPHSFLVEGVEVDVVPYGGIEGEDRAIRWPDEHRMNVRGLSEAVESAETVLLPPAGLATRQPAPGCWVRTYRACSIMRVWRRCSASSRTTTPWLGSPTTRTCPPPEGRSWYARWVRASETRRGRAMGPPDRPSEWLPTSPA